MLLPFPFSLCKKLNNYYDFYLWYDNNFDMINFNSINIYSFDFVLSDLSWEKILVFIFFVLALYIFSVNKLCPDGSQAVRPRIYPVF